jgi:hypothetical protein
MTLNRMLLALVGFVLIVPLARAAETTAMVEEASGEMQLAPFDYLTLGQKITLGAHDRLVIDYFASCVRETITGGSVIVGTSISKVRHGKVSREHVACDAKLMPKGSSAGSDAAVVVFRQPPQPQADSGFGLRHRIYSLCPLINLAGSQRVTIERLDQPQAPVTIDIAPDRLMSGGFYDFGAGSCDFAAGGTYRLTAGSRSLIFTVDAGARETTGPVLSRILAF